MGRDGILQQNPLKTPLDRVKYALQSFTPYIETTHQAYLYLMKTEPFDNHKKEGF